MGKHKEIIVIACGAKKLRHIGLKAFERYDGAYFNLAYGYAKTFGIPVYILSSKYGLIREDEIIDYYDMYLPNQGPSYKKMWGEAVARDIHKITNEVTLLVGKTYLEHFEHLLEIPYYKPLEKVKGGMGKHMQFFKRGIKNGK